MWLHKNMFPGRPQPYDPSVTTYYQLTLDGNSELLITGYIKECPDLNTRLICEVLSIRKIKKFIIYFKVATEASQSSF